MNKYANLSAPQAELDFHNKGLLNDSDIKNITEKFIKESKEKGHKKILIITGKGIHSKNEIAVVKPIVIAFLKRHKDIKNFIKARRDRGGSGALEVTLN